MFQNQIKNNFKKNGISLKLSVLIVLIIISFNTYSQQHVFPVKKMHISIADTKLPVDSYDPYLKVKNIGNGLYDVGTKDETTSYYLYVTVKYARKTNGVYVYTVISYDTEYKRIKYLGTTEKLSEMAKGKKGDVIFYIDTKNYLFFSVL